MAKGRNVRVMMTYTDSLDRLAAWFVQLWAESLGKEGNARHRTPPWGRPTSTRSCSCTWRARRTRSSRSSRSRTTRGISPRAYEDLESVGYLDSHTMAELPNVESDATRYARTEAGRPNCTIKLGAIDEEYLGYLMQALEVQTAVAGSLYNRVNLFGQPRVEARKRTTYSRLGRPGYQNAWGM